MQADLALDVDVPEQVAQAVSPSLRDANQVQYSIDANDDLQVTVDADSLGVLRGATSTALMLVKLADRVYREA